MITLKYEDEYGGTRVIYECDSTSLQGGYDNAGVLAHMTRFLMAAGYPLERTEELTPFDGDKEYIIDRKDWDEMRDMVDELQEKQGHTSCNHYLVWWSDEDGVWIAEHPSHSSFKAHSSTHPATALSELRLLEAQERTNADSPIEASSQGEWIPWDGWGTPVYGGTLVQVQLRDDSIVEDYAFAIDWGWSDRAKSGDVIAYRVINEPRSVDTSSQKPSERDTNTDQNCVSEEDV